jgi:hypothetical protein
MDTHNQTLKPLSNTPQTRLYELPTRDTPCLYTRPRIQWEFMRRIPPVLACSSSFRLQGPFPLGYPSFPLGRGPTCRLEPLSLSGLAYFEAGRTLIFIFENPPIGYPLFPVNLHWGCFFSQGEP